MISPARSKGEGDDLVCTCWGEGTRVNGGRDEKYGRVLVIAGRGETAYKYSKVSRGKTFGGGSKEEREFVRKTSRESKLRTGLVVPKRESGNGAGKKAVQQVPVVSIGIQKKERRLVC